MSLFNSLISFRWNSWNSILEMVVQTLFWAATLYKHLRTCRETGWQNIPLLSLVTRDNTFTFTLLLGESLSSATWQLNSNSLCSPLYYFNDRRNQRCRCRDAREITRFDHSRLPWHGFSVRRPSIFQCWRFLIDSSALASLWPLRPFLWVKSRQRTVTRL